MPHQREFLDPFFAALDWDVDNRAGWAEAYKEVIHEDAIKIGGFTKAPDYCFRVGGNRKFFVEAKKLPSTFGITSPAFQLRRYAWSAKLPLSVLTDFEESPSTTAASSLRQRTRHRWVASGISRVPNTPKNGRRSHPFSRRMRSSKGRSTSTRRRPDPKEGLRKSTRPSSRKSSRGAIC
jgi:hypothetical protein